MLSDENLAKIGQLQDFCQWAGRRWLDECQRQNLQFRVAEVYRPQDRQNRKFVQGRTPEIMVKELAAGKYDYATYKRGLQLLEEIGPIDGPIVTWTLSSMHTQRLAVDIQTINCTFEEVEVVANRFGIYRPKATVAQGDYGHFQFDKAFLQPIEVRNPLAYLRALINRQRVTKSESLKKYLPAVILRLAERLRVDLTKFDL